MAIACLIVIQMYSQNGQPTQTIRGKVVDVDSKSAIPFANVAITSMSPMIGVTTDINGLFKIEKVPVGRVNIQISSIGFETIKIPNVLLISGKESILNVEMKESFYRLQAVEVKAQKPSEEMNDMAIISSKELSIEESKRHAGAISDPARLVSSFAGVINEGSGNNDIIVRGNNPRFIQWRLEGTEIPNPNHFALEGLTGGPINAMNSQMLANSTFYAGAFGPQYGNSLSGIFDMSLRKGNDQNQEHSFSVGALGIEFTSEGPINKEKGSSYLLNYRYSTLALLDESGIVDFGGVPKYQDVSYKVHLPTEKMGVFSFFGLGGISKINFFTEDENNENVLLQNGIQRSQLGISGLNHFYQLSEKSYLKTNVTHSFNRSMIEEQRPFENESLKEFYDADLSNHTSRLTTTFNHKVNSKHKVQVGWIHAFSTFDYSDRYFDVQERAYLKGQGNQGSTSLSQAFSSWQWRITQRLTAVNGVHATKSSLNRELVVEPRVALKYQLSEKENLSAGIGRHSKDVSLPNRFALIDFSGTSTTPNRNLELMKATHYILGYQRQLKDNLNLKLEAYYQHLFDIPVAMNSDYSLINQDDFFTDKELFNEGEGRNIGIEMTLERYLSQGFYYLLTASIYDAKYKTIDGKWKNSRYNGNYAGNFLIGKEYQVGKKEGTDKTIGFNSRLTILGGRMFSPIDLNASILEGSQVNVETEYLGQKAEDVIFVNFAVHYRVNKAKLSHELKLDIQNITNNTTAIDIYYDSSTQQIEELPQLSLLPVISYTINF